MSESAQAQQTDGALQVMGQRWTWAARVLVMCGACLAGAGAQAGEAEVLHYWQPEERSTLILKEMLNRQGHAWKDFIIIPGGSTGLLNSLLKSRVQSGNPPFAALVRAPVARQWERQQRLANLDDAARAGQWDEVLPPAIRAAVKDRDRYIAVPVSVYQENGLWLNNRLLRHAGASAPHDWPSFFDAADKLRRAGVVAVAHGGQQRGNLHLFSSVALGVGGPDFYRRAFVQGDPTTLSGEVMEKVLMTFRRIKPYTRADIGQRDWQDVSRDLVDDRAAMVFMGGWAAPVFAAAKTRSDFDYSCVASPGSGGAFSYLIDSFAMFRLHSAELTRAQQQFASGLLAPAVQARLNRERGAIPARADTDIANFDACARQSAAAFRKAQAADTLVPSFALAVSAPREVEIAEIVSAFWIDDSMTPRTAMKLLAAAVK